MVFSTIAKSYFDEFPFRRNDRRKPNSEYFFLSHAHTDHTKGLKGSLTDPDATIVCSRETAAAIKVLYRIPSEKCLIVKPNQILSFDNFNIYVLDANHCLGSLMFVIESIKGSKEIFTGDFRLGQSIFDDLDLLREPDQLWVDFTYGKNPLFQFPSREDLISEIITLILSEGNFPEKNVWISSYQVGKELLFKTISTALGVKIWAPEEKYRIYKEIGGDWDIYTADSESGVF
ncbi:hypothetical protein, partial [Candidatus Hodarchaeum mangrovi]